MAAFFYPYEFLNLKNNYQMNKKRISYGNII